jgi:hypothetical protein
MSKREIISKEVATLYSEGAKIAFSFQENDEKQFQYDYQSWYTKALKVVSSFALDRLAEFKAYYEIDPKRKSLGYGTYVIQDFLKNVVPSHYTHPDFNSREQTLNCFFNQLTIFRAICDRLDSAMNDIEGELYAELQDSELTVARQLAKISLRAAGALAGVVIEGHLQKVAASRRVKIAKKNPTISDLNDPLKAASVIDVATWRKIAFLGDLRNLCSHKKDFEPTNEQVHELIDGAEWLSKNVF